MAGIAKTIPVVLSFPESAARKDCWGRIEAISPMKARLSTRFELARGDRFFIAARLGAEEFPRLEAVADRVEREAEGYHSVELTFTDEVQRRGLAKALLDLMAT